MADSSDKQSEDELHAELGDTARKLIDRSGRRMHAIPVSDSNPPVYLVTGSPEEIIAAAHMLQSMRRLLSESVKGRKAIGAKGLRLVVNKD